MVQMSVTGGDVEKNLQNAVAHIATAAKEGAQIALLPECLDIGWTHPAARELAQPIPDGRSYQSLAKAAREHKITVCAGLTERLGDKVFNAAVLIGPDGELLGRHRKLNELEIGHAFYDQGDGLAVVHTELGTIGVMICADAFARDNAIAKSLGYMGADFILSPCAWAVPPDHDNAVTPYGSIWIETYGPVARMFSMPIIGVSNVGEITGGPWVGHRCIGNSIAVGHDGDILAVCSHGVHAQEVRHITVQTVNRPARGSGWWEVWSSPSES